MDIAGRHGLRLFGSVFTRPEERQLFILGHMRSGSSLLSTILTNNPEVNGYGEAKIVYRGGGDFRTLRGKVALVQLLNRRCPTRRMVYIHDKILHERLVPNPTALAVKGSYLIFQTRSPEPTLRSIVGSLGWGVPQASQYLLNQYQYLAMLAQRLPSDSKAIRLGHQELIESTDQVLAALTCWLGLKAPLSADFGTKTRVKLRGSSDRSGRLDAGRVLRDQSRHDVDISAAPLADIEGRYRQMKDIIEERLPHWSELSDGS
jgi:hypothetical protein